ncbi:hypothetical protein [Neorhizobium sp. P12A]|uniref:phthiocerol/phthiodiolone dimycocerosyl transferase family protein n=1 Tax=Neorhizobium sp. P12A TaxID=2268027 RepID=UPI0011EFCC6F|nr:hypothetical protein [Neorhizobium sp. P12A]
MQTRIVPLPSGGVALCKSTAEIGVEFNQSKSEIDWRPMVASGLAMPFSAGDTLARLSVVEGPERTVIALFLDHAIADGISSTYVVEDLLRALGGENIGEGSLLPSAPDLIGSLVSNETSFVKSPAADIAEAMPSAPAAFPPPYVSTIALSQEETAALAGRARLEGATVHGALCAALTFSLAESAGKSSHVLVSPIDLRRIIPVDTRTCSQIFTMLAETLDMSGSFWDIARRSVSGVEAARSLEAFMIGAQMMENFIPAGSTSATAHAVMSGGIGENMLSNLGVIDMPDRYGDLSVEAFWGPMAANRLDGYHFIGAATYGGSLRLTCSTHELLPDLLTAMGEHLRNAC